MKVAKCIAVLVGVVLVAAAAHAQLSVGGKVWYVDNDEFDDAGFMLGPTVSLDLGESLYLSAMYLYGSFDVVSGFGTVDYDAEDAEAILGMSADIWDIGVGFRYSTWSFEGAGGTVDIDIYGPMAYAGLGNTFGDQPLGWYASASYMFYDFGDADDAGVDGFEHYNIEAGVFLALDNLMATFGYRYKDYFEYDDLTFDGLAGSVSYRF